MPPRLTALFSRIGRTVNGFSFAQKTVSILAVLVLVLGVTGLSVWLSQPQYVPLFTGVSASDAASITDQLHTDNVSYQLTDGGDTILVPQADVYAERLKAAAAGLPSSTNQGYSLLDKMGVTTSEFQQDVTYKRAMEGELANTIDAMDGVKTASVKLAIPEQTVFTDSAQDPTASVFIATDSGVDLTQDQVQAIVHLTSASIVGMKPTDVSVIDANGDVLSTVGGGPTGSSGQDQSTYESAVQTNVQAMLDKVLGAGNSTVVANAQMDDATATKTTQQYTIPTGAPVTSSSDQKETYSGDGSVPSAGVLGISNTTDSTTDGTGSTVANATGGSGSYVSDNLTKDNALNETTETQQIPAGELQRLTVSVAVNKKAAHANGVTTTQLQSLVDAAAGINRTRGDSVSVQFVGFSKASAIQAQQALNQASQQAAQQQLFSLIKDGAIGLGILLAALIAAFMWRRRAGRAQDDLDSSAGESSEVQATPAAPILLPVSEEEVDTERRKAEIGALAQRDPQRAAEFLRGLMDDRRAS